MEEAEEEQPMEASLPRDRQSAQLYPVSMVWQPPFTQLVDLVGHGDMQVRAMMTHSKAWWFRGSYCCKAVVNLHLRR